MAFHGPGVPKEAPGFWANRPGYKPVQLLIAAAGFTVMLLLPPPQSMVDLVSRARPPGYVLPSGCTTITDTVNNKLRSDAYKADGESGHSVTGRNAAPLEEGPAPGVKPLLAEKDVAWMAKAMLAIFCLAVFLWGTETLPLGATDILVAVMLYLFTILPMDEISKAYMSDAVSILKPQNGQSFTGNFISVQALLIWTGAALRVGDDESTLNGLLERNRFEITCESSAEKQAGGISTWGKHDLYLATFRWNGGNLKYDALLQPSAAKNLFILPSTPGDQIKDHSTSKDNTFIPGTPGANASGPTNTERP